MTTKSSDNGTRPELPSPGSATVLSIKTKADPRKSSEKKFGKPVMDLGFCIVPSLLMWGQARLGINAVQFNIIMHLADIWWEKENRPWPKKQLLAERMGMSERQIQRQIAELEAAGLIQRIERTRPGRGKTSNEYDLSGLVRKLQALEPEFAEMKRENQKRRQNVALPQHRRKA